MKILIIKFRNIGDVLLSTPLLENLKFHYPEAKIDYALNKGCEDVISLNPAVSNIFIYDRNSIKTQGIFRRIKSEITFVQNIIKNKYDIVINLTEGDRGTIIAWLSNAKIKLGYKSRNSLLKLFDIFDKVGSEENIHTVLKDLQFINLLDKEVKSYKVSIFWTKEDERKVDLLLKDEDVATFIHIHPVSRWMFKCWEDDRMAAIIDYLQQEKNMRVIITAAPDNVELKRVKNILSLCKTRPTDLSAKLTLKQLAYLSSKAERFFGVDTAPMHIAAVDTPVIALFGASYPNIWGPWNNSGESRFIFKNGVQKHGIHLVVSQRDHSLFYENNIKKSRGMNNIDILKVIRVLDECL